MEILNEGDEAGEGLVRTCVFPVPKYLLSGGKGRSWETVTEATMDKLSRYVAIGKPLWSRAEGYHELEEQPDGTTVLTFHETYHAYNPLLRLLLERPVHAKISRDNIETTSTRSATSDRSSDWPSRLPRRRVIAASGRTPENRFLAKY